jgi:hypothetical protein
MKAAMVGMLGAATAGLLAGASARAQAPPPPDVDRDFVCPELLDDDGARLRQLTTFIATVGLSNPSLSRPDILAYRRQLLQKHQCARTLQAQKASQDNVQNGDVQDQTWLKLGANAEVTLAIGPDSIGVLTDPRHPEQRVSEAYVRASYSAPQRLAQNQVTYDEVVSHALFYCPSGQRALVENDFFLRGKPVLKQPSQPESVTPDGVAYFTVTPVPQGSLNAVAVRWICGSLDATVTVGAAPARR